MKLYILLITIFIGNFGISQDLNKEQLKADKNATNFVYKANELVGEDNYVEAEMEYRKAISEAPTKATGAYNLAHSYYTKGSFDEALFRSQEAANNATTKDEKHRAFHNIGNILMQNKQCKEAVEAYKNALRNNPLDEESRYVPISKKMMEEAKMIRRTTIKKTSRTRKTSRRKRTKIKTIKKRRTIRIKRTKETKIKKTEIRIRMKTVSQKTIKRMMVKEMKIIRITTKNRSHNKAKCLLSK